MRQRKDHARPPTTLPPLAAATATVTIVKRTVTIVKRTVVGTAGAAPSTGADPGMFLFVLFVRLGGGMKDIVYTRRHIPFAVYVVC